MRVIWLFSMVISGFATLWIMPHSIGKISTISGERFSSMVLFCGVVLNWKYSPRSVKVEVHPTFCGSLVRAAFR